MSSKAMCRKPCILPLRIRKSWNDGNSRSMLLSHPPPCRRPLQAPMAVISVVPVSPMWPDPRLSGFVSRMPKRPATQIKPPLARLSQQTDTTIGPSTQSTKNAKKQSPPYTYIMKELLRPYILLLYKNITVRNVY